MNGDPLERIPPQDLGAEMATLGSMLLESEAAGLALEALDREDFYSDANKAIFAAIKWIFDQGHQPDEVLLRDVLERKGLLDRVGGEEYLDRIVDCVPSAASMVEYAGIVKRHSLMRKLIVASTATLREAEGGVHTQESEGPLSGQEIVARGAERLSDLSMNGHMEDAPVPLKELVQEQLAELEERRENPTKVWGLATGLNTFDHLTGGLHESEFTIIAGRPSHGKTSMILTWLEFICRQNGKDALLFSAESRKEEIFNRLIAMKARVPFQALKSGMLADEAWSPALQAFAEVGESHLTVDDAPRIPIERVLARSRYDAARRDLALVAVDYIQLLRAPRGRSREQEVAQVSADLKVLARELKIPVVALSQLRRTEDDRRPRMSDLRESGALEQDADNIVLLHRKTQKEEGDYDNRVSFELAKQRNGPTRLTQVVFLPLPMQFRDLHPEEREETP